MCVIYKRLQNLFIKNCSSKNVTESLETMQNTSQSLNKTKVADLRLIQNAVSKKHNVTNIASPPHQTIDTDNFFPSYSKKIPSPRRFRSPRRGGLV